MFKKRLTKRIAQLESQLCMAECNGKAWKELTERILKELEGNGVKALLAFPDSPIIEVGTLDSEPQCIRGISTGFPGIALDFTLDDLNLMKNK